MEEVHNIINKTLSTFVFPCEKLFIKRLLFKNKSALNESRSIIKPVTTRFNHLKWKMTDQQKQFLDDFIGIDDDILRESDIKYASNHTGIPMESIKSIRNTYKHEPLSNKDLLTTEEMLQVIDNSAFSNIGGAPKYIDLDIKPEYRPSNKVFLSGRKSNQKKLEDKYNINSPTRITEVKIDKFIYEWLIYVLKGQDDNNIILEAIQKQTSLSEGRNCILLTFNHGINTEWVDKNTHKETEHTNKVGNILTEFNSIFGTNFIMTNQLFSINGLYQVVIENVQVTDGIHIYNKNTNKYYTNQMMLSNHYKEKLTKGQINNGDILFRKPIAL